MAEIKIEKSYMALDTFGCSHSRCPNLRVCI